MCLSSTKNSEGTPIVRHLSRRCSRGDTPIVAKSAHARVSPRASARCRETSPSPRERRSRARGAASAGTGDARNPETCFGGARDRGRDISRSPSSCAARAWRAPQDHHSAPTGTKLPSTAVMVIALPVKWWLVTTRRWSTAQDARPRVTLDTRNQRSRRVATTERSRTWFVRYQW